MSHYPPSAHTTLELITEGRRLKNALREQYRDQIEAALREQKATLSGNKSGTNSVEMYYYSSSYRKEQLDGGSPNANQNSVSEGKSPSNTSQRGVDRSEYSGLSPLSKREQLIAQGYLPPSAATNYDEVSAILLRNTASTTNTSPLAPAASTASSPSAALSPASTRDAIKATQKALLAADAQEQRLKALISHHDPIRASLRHAQEKAIQSLIGATESSLAWEMRLAAEEKDPIGASPIRKAEEEAAENQSGIKSADTTHANATEASPIKPTSAPSSSPTQQEQEQQSSPSRTLLTSPSRPNTTSAAEKAALERRLELLLKLQKEHQDATRITEATKRIADERKRFVEEAVDVIARREYEKAQKEEQRQQQQATLNRSNPDPNTDRRLDAEL